ncbi:IS1 family transposase [Oxynema sp. CENA135]|nr:IS1 family transposase [Oxynema sp. CENA135]
MDDIDRVVNQQYMTRVEGKNTRLRHNLARLHRKNVTQNQ